MHEVRRKLSAGLVAGLALVAVPTAAGASHPAAGAKAKTRVTYPKRGAAFVGVTSQKSGALALPVDVRASASGHAMTRLDLQWSAACTSATGMGSYGGLSISLNKKIVTPGVFTDANTFTRAFSGGAKGIFTIKLYGRFTSPGRVAGTMRVTVTVLDATGATTDTCDSGLIKWSATN